MRKGPHFSLSGLPNLLIMAGAWIAVSWTAGAQAAALTGVATVVTGGAHSCALTTGGGVKCWGANDMGQLGDGTTANRSNPVDVTGFTSGVAAVAAGYAHTCALSTAGAVSCWGDNSRSQLGNGSLAGGVSAISAGAYHTCALTSGGGLKCWGENFWGALGNGTNTSSAAPVDVTGLSSGVVAVAAGGGLVYGHTCALTATGGVKCWGHNERGELGNGTTTESLVPVDVTGLSSGVAAITTGFGHSCALMTAGSVKCWGTGVVFTQGQGTPYDVAGLASGVAAIASGERHLCALTTAGGLECVGENGRGQLGNGSSGAATSSASDIPGHTSGMASIASGFDHGCAATATGGAKCWGAGDSGQMGNGSLAFTQAQPRAVGTFAPQTITFGALANREVNEAPFSIAGSATASSGLPVTYASNASNICAVSGSTLTLLDIGICTIVANQAGDDVTWQAAPEATRYFLVSGVKPSSPIRLANVATRARASPSGDNYLIAGFIIDGGPPADKLVVVRARGPSLASQGVGDAMPDPSLKIYSGQLLVFENDNWQQAFNAAAIESIGFAPSHPLESAILLRLDRGPYTAVVTGTGVGIVEVFEIDNPQVPLINIATRAQVLTGEDVMIAGFIIHGPSPQTVVVRARGPSLSSFGIDNFLADPLLQLFSGQAQIAVNDNWQSSGDASNINASGFAPSNAQESAILMTLDPGAYTAVVSGTGGGTGIGLVEVFAVP